MTFETTKRAMMDTTTLAYPAPNTTLSLTRDASDVTTGAVLEQITNVIPQPLAFYSRKHQSSETRYSTFNRELLTIYSTIHHFRYFLEGTPFTINMDHQPLVYTFTKSGDTWSAWQQRHLWAIAKFGCTIRYIPSRKNPVANALSHTQINAVRLGIDKMSWQISSKRTQRWMPTTPHQWQDIPFNNSGRTLLCNVSTGHPCSFIPAHLRRKLFYLVHGLAHLLEWVMATLVRKQFVWHGINKDICCWAKACMAC